MEFFLRRIHGEIPWYPFQRMIPIFRKQINMNPFSLAGNNKRMNQKWKRWNYCQNPNSRIWTSPKGWTKPETGWHTLSWWRVGRNESWGVHDGVTKPPWDTVKTIGILLYDGFFTMDAMGPLSVLNSMYPTEKRLIGRHPQPPFENGHPDKADRVVSAMMEKMLNEGLARFKGAE